METTQPKNCSQCSNACPVDRLKCGRGRAWLARLSSGEELPEQYLEEGSPLLRLITCGRVAEHKAKMVRVHNGDPSRVLQCLSQEEQLQLAELLGRLE